MGGLSVTHCRGVSTLKAIFVHKHGGPEVLQVEDIPTPTPNHQEVLVNNQAIGVNFVDMQHRAGLNYPVNLPLIPGTEAAGLIEAVGSDVTEFKVGDRVGYAGYMGGNYAEYTVVPEAKLIPIPVNLSFELAAAALLQGMTAHCLTYSVYPIKEGDVVLVQAAAGGVGLFLVQLAKQRGATVIAVVSSAEKAALVRTIGADHAIIYTQTDVESETLRLTHGEGVQAVYDSVGRTTFDTGLRVLRAQGHMIIFGLSSGPVPPFDINRLSGITGSENKGSLFLTWATLSDYAAKREDLLWRAKDVLDWIAEGSLKVHIARTFPLTQAAEAHRLIESRQVVGKVLLLPWYLNNDH
jgi:NADPH2:quinone reductase